MTVSRGMRGFGAGVAVVEDPRDTNDAGRGMGEIEANRLPVGSGALAIVMVMVVFHTFISVDAIACMGSPFSSS